MIECLCIIIMPYFLKTKISETNQIITGSDSGVTISIIGKPYCPSMSGILHIFIRDAFLSGVRASVIVVQKFYKMHAHSIFR